MINFKIATSKSELLKVFNLRYLIYFKKMGGEFNGLNHNNETLRDELDDSSSINIISESSKKNILGTIRVNMYSNNNNIPDFFKSNFEVNTFLKQGYKSFIYISFPCIHEDYEETSLIKTLIKRTIKFSLENKNSLIILNSRDYLVPFWEKFGFKKYKKAFTTETFEKISNPMYIQLDDEKIKFIN